MTEQTEQTNIFGMVERHNNNCFIVPIDKGARPFIFPAGRKLKNGDFVELEPVRFGRRQELTLLKNYGPCSLSIINEVLISRKYQIPRHFSAKLMRECKKFADFEQDARANLTDIPFVTIDGDDSKDFDDAVYAQKNESGFLLMVAIADVSFYVRSGSELDREAYLRGNSVYLPQTVIPMLPEVLSNDLCSLNPQVRRPAVVCSMHIDNRGHLLQWNFRRAVIKSAARLTYNEVEKAIHGEFTRNSKKVFTTAIQPLYEAYFALNKAREERGTLELVTSEIKFKFGKKGEIIGVCNNGELTANKIIEEFMIAANVAAARFLREHKTAALYRIHDKPPAEKLADIKPLLHSLHLKLPDASALQARHFNRILQLCPERGISDLILRLQCQARYSPDNIGHFGLALPEYVHFTSPIRRYADLTIHRAIVAACKMETDLPHPLSLEQLRETGDHLGVTERRAAAIERDITARYLACYMQPMQGAEFEVSISGVGNAGVFVRIENLGAEGLIPMRCLPADYYELCDAGTKLRGQKYKLSFSLGHTLTARLSEVTPLTGGLIFHYLSGAEGAKTKPKNFRKNKGKKK